MEQAGPYIVAIVVVLLWFFLALAVRSAAYRRGHAEGVVEGMLRRR